MTTRHQQIEQQFCELLTSAALRQPDDVAHLDRVIVFLWHDTKAVVVLDLDELPEDEDPFDGFDVTTLEVDSTSDGELLH